MARWNIYLVNRGEPPLLYFSSLNEYEALSRLAFVASKAFDGSDADGFIMMRSDYPIPHVWPGAIQ